MDNYKPRGPLCLVKRIKENEAQSETGIYLPDQNTATLAKFEILRVGPNVEDLQPGDIVLAEDAFQPINKLEPGIGLLSEKYIHLIYGH